MNLNYCNKKMYGDVAQMVERSLSMREVRGSIPRISILFAFFSNAHNFFFLAIFLIIYNFLTVNMII